jgi:glycosyltransferase involved in cell wall biosynthesis
MTTHSIRVAWDNSLTRRNPTGTGVYAAQLIRELSAIPEMQLTVLEGWDPAKRKRGEFGSQGVVARGARALSGLLWHHGYLPLMLRRGRFDVLHCPAFVIPSFCPCPAVVTIHDLSFRRFPGQFERRWQSYLNRFMPRILRSAAGVICVSEFTKQELLAFYAVDPAKLHVVYHGIDHTRFKPGVALDSDWARSVGLSRDYLLHVGTVSERKNIPLLLRALASLKARGRLGNLQLLLAGPELSVLSGASDIRQAVQKLGLGEVVVFAGQVPDQHLPGLYAQARLLLMPSFYEGFGLPVLESMASGTPLVASDAASLPEIAGGAAVLAPPDDDAAWATAILEILESPAKAAGLRQRGLARAREFSWQRAASETAAIYRGVVGR